jgi:predicted CxxxxCH...CXXCH cytochrome family protein
MRTGTVFLSSICLLLLTSYAAAQDCGCNTCHGNPPLYDNIFGGPNGLVGSPMTGATSAGAHAQHVPTFTGPSFNTSCYECHFGGMPYSSICANYNLQIGFKNRGIVLGGNYDGHTLNPPFSYEGTNGTAITSGGTKVCSNIYCHSDGTAVVTGVVPDASKSPAWDSKAGPLACTSCHSYPPSYPQLTNASATPKANAHAFHMVLSLPLPGCQVCHYLTTTNGSAITDPTRHANGAYDVAPAPVSYFGKLVDFTYRPDPGGIGGFCDNVSCHGGSPNTRFWGKFLPSISGFSMTFGPGCYEVRNFSIPAGNFTNTTFPITYTWDFGNGDTESGTAASAPVVSTSSHIYASTGPYVATVTGRDALKRLIYTEQQVSPQRSANVSPTGTFSASANRYTVTLTALTLDPDYGICGETGAGLIYLDAGTTAATINGKSSPLTGPITLTTQPANKIYTIVYPAGTATYTIGYSVRDSLDTTWTVRANQSISVPGTTTISGLVTDSSGAGVSGATVNLNQTFGGLITSTTTASDGSYSFSGALSDACFMVQAFKTGYTMSPATQTVCINRSDVNFTASP